MIDIETAFSVLVSAQVEFIVVGGVAARAHGSARLTNDVDVLYRRAPDNVDRLVAALAPHAPYLRGAPPGLPFRWDAPTIRRGLNFTLTTTFGDIDLLGEMSGLGGFAVVRRLSAPMTVYGREVRVLTLEGLERAKRAAGRIKDIADLAEILELRKRGPEGQ